MWIKGFLAAAGLMMASGSALCAETPMSAIDWLSDSVATPVAMAPPDGLDGPETDVTDSAAVEEITVTPLDIPTPDAVGLLPASVTGLPRGLWGASSSTTLARLIRSADVEALPAARELLYMMLLAELDPPDDADGSGALFLARIDKLLELGALEQAQALLELAGADTPDLFRRLFDVTLLTGTEDGACTTLRANADFSPTFPARIFCLARGGDWNAAALTLETAKALGVISAEEDALLARFLDPELFEGEAPLPAPSRPSPLVFRMREAIGEPIPTASLPRAFAQADLRSTAGWKAQVEAAERLARIGAIDENRLLGIYTARRPAASGGVWDRVAALQDFDAALAKGDADEIADTLPVAWAAMQRAGLELPFARLYGDRLSGVALAGKTADLAFRIGLLTPQYEEVAQGYDGTAPRLTFLRAIAMGQPATPPRATGNAHAAIATAFSGAPAPADLQGLARADRLGEAILRALALLASGADGDTADLARGLQLLRAVGLERTARQTALQFLLLNRQS